MNSLVFKRLGEVAKVEWGNTSITKKFYVESGVTAFSASGPDGFLPKAQWNGPGVVLSAIGARCGKCFYADGGWTAIKNTIVIQSSDPDVSHKFLFYYLNNPSRWKIAGSGQPFITLKTARETLVPIAIPNEQCRIVAEIEKQFTRLDAGVAALRRVQASLKRYRAAVLKAACEGRLVPGSFKKWAEVTVGDSVKIIDYRGRTPPFSDSGIPHLRSQNIRHGRIVWRDLAFVTPRDFDEFMTRGLPEAGDLLFTTEAPMGEVAVAPTEKFSVAQRIMILRANPKIFESRFLMAQLRSPQFQARLSKSGTGSTVTGVSSRNFQPMALHAPPLPEQTRIVAEVERRLSVVEELETTVNANLQRATRLRQSILEQAFAGQLA